MNDAPIVCYALHDAPPFARGLVRDLRVRWALEETGRSYRVELVGDGPGDVARTEYRELQPFGQVPAIVEGDLTLFESGAIVLHLAEESAKLMPVGADRMHAIQWMFSALNTLEPFIAQLAAIDLFYRDQQWAKDRRAGIVEMVKDRLEVLATALDDRSWLVADRFTVADLMMISVLRILRHTDFVTAHPVLGPYLARGEARPAFQRAFAAQMAAFPPLVAT